MIKYIENRIWALNAEIMNFDADVTLVNKQLNESISSGFFKNGGLDFKYTHNPIGNYSERPVEITIEMTEPSLSLYQKQLDDRGIMFRVTSFRMIINTFGFLNVLPVYEFTGSFSENDSSIIERNGDGAAELVDLIFNDILHIIDVLDNAGIIKKSDFYHCGIPSEIEKYNLYTKNDSYNYMCHILFFDEPEYLQRTIQSYQAENRMMKFNGDKLYYVFPLYFWDMNRALTDPELIDQIAIDSYLTCELVTCNNSLHVYNSFFKIINSNKNIDSVMLRQVFNYNNWLVQSLRMFNPNFTLYQFNFIKMYRENSDIIPKYDLLKDSEQALCFAIEGLEVGKTRQSERVMQFILALFTALTLYSVITDIYALITSNEPAIAFSLRSLQSIIFIFETVVILSFIIFFRRISKRL